MKLKQMLYILLFFTGILHAQPKTFPKPNVKFNPKKYICYRAAESFKIDGKLNEVYWQFVPWSDYFVDIEGDSKPAPYYKTRMKMIWDDIYLYIAAELEENHVWAKLKRRDAVIYYDNDFEVFIDPDGDSHNYYELEINAFNTVWDLLLLKPYRDGEKVAVNGWEIKGLLTGVNINGTINDPSDKDESWTVEIAIPWKALGELDHTSVPPKENDQWKINFSRVQWETEIDDGKWTKAKHPDTKKNLPENNWVWSPQGIIAMHYPEMWGVVQFSYKVADSADTLVTDYIDEARWALRQYYYSQKDYFINNNKYSQNFEKLNIKIEKPKNYTWPPNITAVDSHFEGAIYDENTGNVLTIYSDGLIKLYNVRSK